MLGKLYKKWVRKDDGVTAVEFSLLLAPYMMLVLGIIEISLMFTSANLLEGATNSAARLIRTGQLQQSALAPQDVFRDALLLLPVVRMIVFLFVPRIVMI